MSFVSQMIVEQSISYWTKVGSSNELIIILQGDFGTMGFCPEVCPGGLCNDTHFTCKMLELGGIG